MLPVEQVTQCRDRLSQRADLRRYGTAEAVEDLDAVRAALGHEQVDLFALSYGTTVALRYLARYPDRVRTAVLMGVAPPAAMPPRHHAAAGERALRLLFADCAADEPCRRTFPNLEADLDRALSRLPAADASVTPELFMEKIRTMMYSPAAARRIPYIISQAAAGDFGPYRSTAGSNGASMIADGMFLSVTCTETFGFIDYEAEAARARTTRFGDYRLRRQRAACEHWPRSVSTADQPSPPKSRAAVLLLSGLLDPVTPPDWADVVAGELPNSRHYIIRYGGHVLDGLSGIDTCLDPLIIRFYETGLFSGLNSQCLATMQPPPFQVRAQ